MMCDILLNKEMCCSKKLLLTDMDKKWIKQNIFNIKIALGKHGGRRVFGISPRTDLYTDMNHQ